jgi:hypothetical protein
MWGVPSEIMGPQMNTDKAARFFHNHPCCGIAYWEDALVKLDPFVSDVSLA